MIIESVFVSKLLAIISAQIGTAVWKSARSKNVRIIQILEPFNLNKLEDDFKSIYAHTIADLAADEEPKPVLILFEKEEIKTAFENNWIEPKADGFHQSVSQAIEIYALGDDIKGLGLSAPEIADKFTRTFKFYVKKANSGHALLSNEHKHLEELLLERSGFSEKETPLPDLPLNPLPYFAHSRPLEQFWVGRKDELTQITDWYQDEAVKVVGLVAFGGVGKSAMARKWLEDVAAGFSLRRIASGDIAQAEACDYKIDGIFWWCFYREDSLDAFLESALKYFSGGKFRPEEARSAYARVRKLLEYIAHGRFILVLDGLEDMQKAKIKGENFGEMKEHEFTDLLQLWAGGDHNSLALITTRYPLKDLQPYEEKNYRCLPLKHLSVDDARGLMRKFDVKGDDKELNKVTKEYDYHALSIKLIAGYLKEYYEGDISHVPEIPFSALEDDEKVNDILKAYDAKLNKAQRSFMDIFSCFCRPLEEDVFRPVFRYKIKPLGNRALAIMDDFKFRRMRGHLVKLGLISEDKHEDYIAYSTHPLIRRYYYEHLEEKARISIHQRVAQYYEGKAHTAPKTLDDLTYAIEAFHHTIQTKDYDKADEIYKQKINIRDSAGNLLMVNKLGAFELDLSLISQLFPGGDTSKDPMVALTRYKNWLINEVGLCLMGLGRIDEAIPFFQRYIQRCIIRNDWANASVGSENMCDSQLKLGDLAEGEAAARQALDWAKQADRKDYEMTSLAFLGYTGFLLGKNKDAIKYFQQANELEQEIHSFKWLASFRGIYYAKFLARGGEKELAEEITLENFTINLKYGFDNIIVSCYRLLAGLNLDKPDYSQAEEYLNKGIEIARNIGLQEEIALIHLGFARLYLARKELPKADSAIKETLSICSRCRFKIIEIDARNVFAQIYHAADQPTLARTEAEKALSMSTDPQCGYHWGKVDAEEILTQLPS